MTVSRETVFGERLPLAERYAELLATSGVERGLIGPREVDRLWERHLFNCAAPVPRVPEGARVADVGSGAGLPGLVWAIARPDLHVTLIEPLLRRTTWLEEVVADLGLEGKVTVVRARAEEVDQTFDVVTSRAVAALDKLARWCMPLVKPGGLMLALKGRSAAEEVETARATLARLKAGDIVVATYGHRWDLEVPTTLVEVQRRQ
ncbi:16S rRNA m(7)G-527 methyltransferase [Aeromicrobium choanae]|uniref:Ribosomal RNA small subunit methyltransferase G n=1 Tax=Aeromicrobium choanae TaxID=1736691 RepID=A0A1T4YZ75_9ACTN|nr:16S rRNA (guanine(527)-N(7))-methyltransferase RsmG [Aeromicrobium choanae]SKB07074.1 16S rRNA m(7)G-527 methyltransferase [Aeromicrobium choanae]